MKLGETHVFEWKHMKNVSLYLSRDGGLTYSETIAEKAKAEQTYTKDGKKSDFVGQCSWIVTRPCCRSSFLKIVNHDRTPEEVLELSQGAIKPPDNPVKKKSAQKSLVVKGLIGRKSGRCGGNGVARYR